MADNDASFAARWSQRKLQARVGPVPPEAPMVTPPIAAPATVAVAAPAVPAEAVDAKPELPALTLADVAKLGRDSDYSPFVARSVTPEVKNAALKQLFTDPHFNVMDGLDTYIDDYGKPDPLPLSMLRQMTQAKFLGIFDDEEEAPALAAATPPPDSAINPAPRTHAPEPAPEPLALDEDTDLQLQPQHAAGRESAQPGAGEDPGRER
jgi:Protein of unknown function (DUF3306)